MVDVHRTSINSYKEMIDFTTKVLQNLRHIYLIFYE